MRYSERERAVEVKLMSVKMPCPKCDGEMNFAGVCYPISPPFYAHKCTKCGYEESFQGVTYPRVEYEEIGEGKGVNHD